MLRYTQGGSWARSRKHHHAARTAPGQVRFEKGLKRCTNLDKAGNCHVQSLVSLHTPAPEGQASNAVITSLFGKMEDLIRRAQDPDGAPNAFICK